MSTTYLYKPQPKKTAAVVPVQLQSVQTNELYNRRNRAKSVTPINPDCDLYEDDRFQTIPDEVTPTKTIKTPPSFIKMIGTTKVSNIVFKTHSIGV